MNFNFNEGLRNRAQVTDRLRDVLGISKGLISKICFVCVINAQTVNSQKQMVLLVSAPTLLCVV